MANINVSSPGKLILHGEHAVVYGKRALAASLNIRTFLRLRRNGGDNISLELPDIGVRAQYDRQNLQTVLQLPLCPVRAPVPASDVMMENLRKLAGISSESTDTKELAVVAFLYLFNSITPINGELPPVSLFLSSNLPVSAGLGSSAAYSTCLSAGLLELAGVIEPGEAYTQEDLQLINDWAFQSEKVIHGNPSGIDNSVSTYGGALCFQGGKITPISKVPKLGILLTNTKVPRSTKVLVAGVREKYNKYPGIIGPVIDSIEAICNKCEQVFAEMDENSPDKYQILHELMTMNQHHLSVLGVSHSSLDTICRITSQYGLASKLTGAGGGGCAFTLIPPGTESSAVKDVIQALEAESYSCWQTLIGGDGVTRHAELDSGMTLPNSFTLS